MTEKFSIAYLEWYQMDIEPKIYQVRFVIINNLNDLKRLF